MDETNYILLEVGIDNQSNDVIGLKQMKDISEVCISRIKMIKEIEQEEQKGILDKREVKYDQIRRKNKFIPTTNLQEYIPSEVVSHFLCKMAYAFYAPEEEWHNFIKAEAIILFEKLNNKKIEHYFSNEVLKVQQVPNQIYRDALHKIRSIFHKDNYSTFSESDYVFNQKLEMSEISQQSLVMFFDHPNILKNSHVVLHKGYIIIRKQDSGLVIKNIFSERLFNEMKIILLITKSDLVSFLKIGDHQQETTNSGSKLDDERFSFLKDLHKAEIFFDETQYSSTSIQQYEIDKLAKRDMPACMNYLMNGLNEKHHLKHFGRLQLGLFLKGAGLSLNDALSFWSQKFSKVTAEDFKKKYDYNIRHNYGKLGKLTDYTPMSCQKVIQQQPLNDEYHGCPFKTLESKRLKAFLKINYNISDEDFLDIDNFKKSKNYQLACRQVFKIRNQPKDKKDDQFEQYYQKVGNHPNAYFEQSLRLHEPQRFEKAEYKKQNKNNQRPDQQSATKFNTNRKNNNDMELEF